MIPAIVIFMGIVFALFGYHSLAKHKKLTTESFEVVSGTISKINSHSVRTTDGMSTSFYAVLDFTYQNNHYSKVSSKEIRVRKANKDPDGKKFAVGDIVGIRVYNSDVETIVIDSESLVSSEKQTGIAFCALGAFLAIVGMAIAGTQ